jgi:hypothetical protein
MLCIASTAMHYNVLGARQYSNDARSLKKITKSVHNTLSDLVVKYKLPTSSVFDMRRQRKIDLQM